MDEQTTLLLALGLLAASSLLVGVSGFVLLARDRRAHRAAAARPRQHAHAEER